MPGKLREPSQEELDRRRLVGINAETVSNVHASDFPHHYVGEDNSWDLEKFTNNLKINFHKNDTHDATFSLVGVDAAIANAYRRILLAEIPTLAIEEVYVYNNTSIIQDEVLCHRMGLIPFTGSTEGLRWMRSFKKKPPADDAAAVAAARKDGAFEDKTLTVPNDRNTVVLRLRVRCEWRENGKELAKSGETDADKLYINSSVYAHQIVFEPQGEQTSRFAAPGDIKPVNPDILIAKLRPGQEIDMHLHCIKGLGGDHAKFSPVATASYRLLPSIHIKQPILGADARKFARCFPKGVIGLEDDEESGEKKAVVKDTMKDTVSRECLRHDEFKDKVQLGRVRDHFIFSVESSGQFPSDELFIDSVKVLREKAARFQRNLAHLMR